MSPNANEHNIRLPKNTNNSFNYSVPNLSLYKSNKFTKENKPMKKSLILDLDETLVHSSFYPFERASDLTLPIKVDNQKRLVYILRRPYALEFIKEMSLYYEIIVYTASIPEYASNLLDEFDKYNVISKRFYRYNCIHKDGIYIKDLRLIGKPFKDLIIIDNNPISYLYNIDNGLPILSWYGDKQDIELLKFIPLLKYLAKVEDVTEIIPQIVNRAKNKIKFSLINKLIDNDDSNSNLNINNNFGANLQRNYHENSADNKYNNGISSNNLNYSFNKPNINIILNRNDNRFNHYMNANCNESSELRDSVFSPEEPSLTINEINEERKTYNNNLNYKNDLTNKININEKSNYFEFLNRTPVHEKKNNKSYTPDLDTHKAKIQKFQENGSMTNIHCINDQKNYNFNNQKNNFYKKKNNTNGNNSNNNNYHNINTVKYNNNKISFTTPNNQANNNINNNIKKYFIPIPKVIQNINGKKIENKENNINSNSNNNKANKQNINNLNNQNENYISNSNDNEKNRNDFNNYNNNNYNIFYRKKEIENGGYEQNNTNNRSNIPNIRNNINNDNNYFDNNNRNINNNQYVSDKNNFNLSNNYCNYSYNKVNNNINLNNNNNNNRNKLNNINNINEYNNKIFEFYRPKYKVNYITKQESDKSDIYMKNNSQNNDYHFNIINNNYSFNNQILNKYNDSYTNDNNFYSEKLKSVNDRINEIRETLNKAEHMLKEGNKNSFSEEKIEKENIDNIINNKSLNLNTNNININHNKNIKYFSNNNIFDLNPEKNEDFYQNENCPSLNELINYKNYSVNQQKEKEENDIDNNNDYSKRQMYNNLNSRFFNNNENTNNDYMNYRMNNIRNNNINNYYNNTPMNRSFSSFYNNKSIY